MRFPPNQPLEDDIRIDEQLKVVLFVDDDAKLLKGLQRVFQQHGGFHVLTAISPSEAKAMLLHYEVDLIVSDNLMTGEMGTRFLADVHREYPTIKLVMLSGFMPPEAADRVRAEAGVSHVLNKPCDAKEILATAWEVLRE